MKKFKGLLVALFAVILLAGCGMKEKVGLIISNDKKVSFEIKILMDDELIDTMLSMSDGGVDSTGATKTYTDEDRWEYFKENLCGSTQSDEFECDTVTEGNFKGAVLKVESKDISEFVGDSTSEKINLASIGDSTLNALFKQNGNTYSSNFEYNAGTTTVDYTQYKDQMSAFSITFEVTLPNKPISNNADEVSRDGLTLTWDLSTGASKSIDFSFEFDGTGTTGTNTKTTTTTTTTTGTNDDKLISTKDEGMSTTTLVLIIVCSVLGLALISVLIVLFARKSTKNPIPASPVSDSAAAFKNPEIHPTKASAEEPVTEKPVEEEPTKEEPKKDE